MAENCSKTAINSHLLQKNGILDNLAENGHLIQLKPPDLFRIDKSGFVEFKTIGIDQGISYPLFCNAHDTAVFKPIESAECDFSSINTQLLFSYRALCAELRKKDRDKEIHKRLLGVGDFQHLEEFKGQIRRSTNDIEQGIVDLNFFKSAFEDELSDPVGRFVFFTGKYAIAKVAISAVCSYNEGISSKTWPVSRPLPTIFVNVFPKDGVLYAIIGYCVDCASDGIRDYVRRWETNQGKNVTALLSDLVTRVETWSMSSSTYRSIPTENVKKYLAYFVDSMDASGRIKQFDINLFDQK
jgi:hypothetical protein